MLLKGGYGDGKMAQQLKILGALAGLMSDY